MKNTYLTHPDLLQKQMTAKAEILQALQRDPSEIMSKTLAFADYTVNQKCFAVKWCRDSIFFLVGETILSLNIFDHFIAK